MPVYEYKCDACGHCLELLQKMSDAPLEKCPQCAKNALRKLISAAAFKLKGTGWYETDFKGGSKKPSTEKPDSKEKGKSAEGSGSTESKPEQKAGKSGAKETTGSHGSAKKKAS